MPPVLPMPLGAEELLNNKVICSLPGSIDKRSHTMNRKIKEVAEDRSLLAPNNKINIKHP